MRKVQISKYLTIVMFLAGIVCFILFMLIGSTVDSNGILHEPFFLITFGYLFVLAGLISSGIYWFQKVRHS